MTSQETLIAAQQRFGAAVNSGDLDALDDLVARDSVDHDPAPGQLPGPQGFRDMFIELRTAFPDLRIEVEQLTANNDDFAFAYTVTGTHHGPLQGHEPTGALVSSAACRSAASRTASSLSVGAAPTSSA